MTNTAGQTADLATQSPHVLSARTVKSIHDIPSALWDECAGERNPFVRHAFLALLEDSGSVSEKTGWYPFHIVIDGPNGTIAGCAPAYVKTNSYGEYVFDWGWAEAFERAGGHYYPKLQCAVPFTPATGPRLLVRPDAPPHTRTALVQAMVALAERLELSSVHVTFPDEVDFKTLKEAGLMPRLGYQFIWQNDAFGCFNDFLDTLASRKRKAIRKERQGVSGHGITLRTLTGAEIEERHLAAFYGFYRDTIDRKWAHAYLTRDFFLQLSDCLGDSVVLVVAESSDGTPLGGALNFQGTDTLFGRYWGCRDDCKFLHFEACYYRAIDYAIEHGLTRVEAGAQGAHKLQRGYLPHLTYSGHWIANDSFGAAVSRFLDHERPAIEAERDALLAESPFRKEGC
jgi:predicted N-acyltransferase